MAETDLSARRDPSKVLLGLRRGGPLKMRRCFPQRHPGAPDVAFGGCSKLLTGKAKKEHSKGSNHQEEKPRGEKAEMNTTKPACGEEVGNRGGGGGRQQWNHKLRPDRRAFGCQVKTVHLLCENLRHHWWGFA